MSYSEVKQKTLKVAHGHALLKKHGHDTPVAVE